jgi:hypothetical protein
MARPAKFRAPRAITSLAQVVKALFEVQDDLALATRTGYTLALQTANFTPQPDSYNRVSPPPTGMHAVMPAAGPDNAASEIKFNIEHPEGTFFVDSAPGQTVNGLAQNSFTVPGIVVFISNGVDAWNSTSQIPGGIGPAGTPGAPGSPGSGQSVPPMLSRAGLAVQGRMGFPGLQGAAGRPGSAGVPGRRGNEGRRGSIGVQGTNGLPGAAGVAGAPGVPGRRGHDGRRAPIIPGPAGAAGSGGGAGSAVELATITLGTAPRDGGSFQITGLSGLTVNDPVLVQLAVSTTDPTESEEQISISGIVTSATVITCYWQSTDGTPKFGTRTVMFSAPTGIWSLGNFDPGEQFGLQIDAGGAAEPVKLTGLEQGENIRFDTSFTDNSVSGDLGATSYQIEEPINLVALGGAGALTIHGIALTGVGGGASVALAGRFVIFRVNAAQVSVTFKHESTTEASAARRCSCPGARDYTAYEGDYVLIIRTDFGGANQRNRVMPFNPGRMRVTTYAAGTSGTHTYLTGTHLQIVEKQAGGGGGGGVEGALAQCRVAGGGQAGRFDRIVNAGTPLGTGAYSVGNGGAGGVGTTGSVTNGVNGGNTDLNGYGGAAIGGEGGLTVTTSPGYPDIRLGGDDTTAGTPGGYAIAFAAAGPGITGAGGSSHTGPGGMASIAPAGAAAVNNGGAGFSDSGAGGAGAYVINSTTDANGGNGAGGYLRIYEYT